MLYTTLKLLREKGACSGGLATLLASLPKNQKEDKLISLSHILKSNGLDHALWALRATTVDSRRIAAFMAIEFASPVLSIFEKQYPSDKRPRTALEAARDFLDGKITLVEVEAASRASYASWAASCASRAASWASKASWAASRAASRAASYASWASSCASCASRASSKTSQEKIFLKYIRTRSPKKAGIK